MKYRESIKIALTAIAAHKLRSALTLLGMSIGVAAVVVVVSLIEGFNAYVDEKVAAIGVKSYSVRRFMPEDWKNNDTIAAAQRRNPKLTIDDYNYLRARATLTAKLGAKSVPAFLQVRAGAQSIEGVSVEGLMAEVGEIENKESADGRFFNESENRSSRRLAFIGADIAEKLFPVSRGVGQQIYLGGIPYEVIGISQAKGTVFGVPQDRFVNIPLNAFAKDFGTLIRQRGLYFVGTATTDGEFESAVEETRLLMRVRHRQGLKDKDDFGIVTPEAITGMRDRIFGPIFVVAIAVPSIALLVGSIVIMNIMLVSVTERTKEIGIRKALGARRSDIMKQFLAESATLSAIGGMVGVCLAWLGGQVFSTLFFQTRLSIPAIVVAVTVSGAIGICSGLLPAWKAARLDPIEALRAE